MVIGIIVGAVLLLVLAWIISTSNKLNTLNVKIDEAESGIDVFLTKRYDLITKMVDTVKGYAKHEKETLTGVIQMRKGLTMQEKNAVNAQMDQVMGRINALAESYPDLKANTSFEKLQASIIDVEENLQAARRSYNSNVSTLNQLIVTFPASIIANAKGTKKREFFEAETHKRDDVKIEF